MAKRYYCDGCDQAISGDTVRRVVVEDKKSDTTTTHGEYELCERCAARLDREANPQKWHRVVAADIGRPVPPHGSGP